MPLDMAKFEASYPENDPVIQINVVCRHEAGWTPYEIQRASGLSFKTINQILTTFEGRATIYRHKVSGATVKRARWPS